MIKSAKEILENYFPNPDDLVDGKVKNVIISAMQKYGQQFKKWVKVTDDMPKIGVDKNFPNCSEFVLTTDCNTVNYSYFEEGEWCCAKTDEPYRNSFKPKYWMSISDTLPVS